VADLLALTRELVLVPSVSGEERALADLVEARLRDAPWLEVTRLGDNVVARTNLGRAERVVLAGHLDTVPGDQAPREEAGTLWGLGSVDMKGGLAVMLDLATGVPAPACDVTYAFYACEEVERARSGLLALDRERPGLLGGSVAVVCEPTGCAVEAGCQGVLKATVTLSGRRSHVARPSAGRNAVHRLAPLLAAVAGWEPRRPELDGCRYQESLQAVRVAGGVASNVVPPRAEVELNYRFAPDRDVAGAVEALGEIVGEFLESEDTMEVTDSAPAAPPSLHSPRLTALLAASGEAVRPKLGWTDVAFFAERGIPAANFGPGDPELAHTAGEHVTRSALESARAVLGQVVAST
jgi:succinyl-diaminopimelate desuccinylase